MKVYRYMSLHEFYLYNINIPIKGKSQKNKNSTVYSGVCFLSENNNFTYDNKEYTFSAEKCYTFLQGIVSNLLVCFETNETLNKGFGIYASPFNDKWDSFIELSELYIDSYSSENFKLVKYCFANEFKWY